MALTIHHIPVCPFSQRIEILLALKGLTREVSFNVIDITRPRPDWLLELSKGTTALPVMEVPGKTPLKESRVLLDYVEAANPEPAIARRDPHEHALESLIVAREGSFGMAGYTFVMNQSKDKRAEFEEKMLSEYKALNDLLENYAPGRTFVFERFGWAEVVFTPFFQRFWFLDYYEGFDIPHSDDFARVRRWRDACLEEPAAQQVTYDQIVKLYYDYALGSGNGALPEGRSVSSFAFEPDWRDRPMPPREKYERQASDAELGLV